MDQTTKAQQAARTAAKMKAAADQFTAARKAEAVKVAADPFRGLA